MSTHGSSEAPVAEAPRRRLPGAVVAVVAVVVGFALGTPLVTQLLPTNQHEPSATVEELREEALQALRAHKHLEAKELVEEALRRNPNDYEALRLLGNALAAEQRHDEATNAYRGFLKLAPADHPRRPFVEKVAASGVTETDL